jgi:C-terminal processing protease CtpA/Prc
MFERTKRALIAGGMVLGWLAASAGVSSALDLPAEPLAKLKSEEFRARESAQAELLAWARQQHDGAMDELFRRSRTEDDPEVRERCLDVLRDLVNDEYLKDGEGFIGIQMLDELANVPGDAKPRGVIRVILVVADSAAQKAGLRLNDLIAGVGDQIWRDVAASLAFREQIRQMKPNTKITLKVLRNGNLMDIEVTLGRRPLSADTLFFGQQQLNAEDAEAADRTAKDAYFRRWLERKKSRK